MSHKANVFRSATTSVVPEHPTPVLRIEINGWLVAGVSIPTALSRFHEGIRREPLPVCYAVIGYCGSDAGSINVVITDIVIYANIDIIT